MVEWSGGRVCITKVVGSNPTSGHFFFFCLFVLHVIRVLFWRTPSSFSHMDCQPSRTAFGIPNVLPIILLCHVWDVFCSFFLQVEDPLNHVLWMGHTWIESGWSLRTSLGSLNDLESLKQHPPNLNWVRNTENRPRIDPFTPLIWGVTTAR